MLKFIAIVFFVVVAVDVYFHASPINALGVFAVIGFFYLTISFMIKSLSDYDD